uniref:Uncharacterized protein n=1 Tax=Acrobeloides nanus TaxID=290746 RepID=A0A914DWS6_9BILA
MPACLLVFAFFLNMSCHKEFSCFILSYDNFKIEYIGYSRAIVTDSWILIISNYTVDFAQTSDLIFRVVKVANHPYLSQDDSGFQLVDVEIESISKKMPNFKIRFVTVFLKQIQDNPKFVYPNKEELDPCLGCSLNLTNVKISRTCDNNTDPDGQNCGVCRCRPMWCGSCMARVFASKQNKDHPEVWMSGKADCPTCRSAFCVLDVCPLE